MKKRKEHSVRKEGRKEGGGEKNLTKEKEYTKNHLIYSHSMFDNR